MQNHDTPLYHTFQTAFVVDLTKRDPANLFDTTCSRKKFCSTLEASSDAEIHFISGFEQGPAFLESIKNFIESKADSPLLKGQNQKFLRSSCFKEEPEYDIIVATIINSSTGFITTVRYPTGFDIFDTESALDWVNSEASVFLLPQKCTAEFIDSFYGLNRSAYNLMVKDQTDLFPNYIRRLVRGISSNGIYSIMKLYQELMEGRPGL